MTKVRILCGGYGHGDLNTLVLRGHTIEVDDGEAQRLVFAGMAKVVVEDCNTPVATTTSADADADEGDDMPDSESVSQGEEIDIPAYSTDNKADELRAIMEAYGLDVKSGMSKADMVDALDAFFATDEEADEGGEDLPDLSAEEPVR